MASAPSYAATPAPWCGQVPASADTSTTSPANFTILGSAGASGTKISQIDVVPLGTVSAGVVNVFAYDGTAYHLVDGVTVTAGSVNSTAGATALKQTLTYDNLTIASGWSLRVSNTVAGNVSLIGVNAWAASL